MKIQVKIKKNRNLSKAEQDLINKNRLKEFGRGEIKDFKKDYEQGTSWFFIKKGKKVVALGGLRPVIIRYLGREYNIFGICSIISIEKKRGYGKILISYMINYSKKTGKTLLGFTKKTEFFKKAGLNAKNDFIRRFVYRNPVTKEEIIDRDGDGIYYEGKDKLITKILSTKFIAYISILHW